MLNEVLQYDLDKQLGYDKLVCTEYGDGKKICRNSFTKHKLKTQFGEIEVEVPRNRNGEYEEKIINKYQRNADCLDDKISSIYTH